MIKSIFLCLFCLSCLSNLPGQIQSLSKINELLKSEKQDQSNPILLSSQKIVNQKTKEFVYTPVNSKAFTRLLNQVKVQQINDQGFPSRLSCLNTNKDASKTNSVFWAEQLSVLLDLPKESDIHFILNSELQDANGIIHLKYNQSYHGVEVLDGQYFVHLYKDQTVLAHGNVFLPNEMLNAKLNLKAAIEVATDFYKSKNSIAQIHSDNLIEISEPKLLKSQLGYWYDKNDKRWHLAYKLKLVYQSTDEWLVLLDSQTGQILKSFRNYCTFHSQEKTCNNSVEITLYDLQELKNKYSDKRTNSHFPFLNAISESPLAGPETTTAKDLLGIDRSINVWREGSTLYLIDGSKPMFNSTGFDKNMPKGAIWTLNANFQDPPQGKNQFSSSTNQWPAEAVSAHYFAGVTYDYFLNTHNRNSIDGKGSTITNYINVGVNYVGAGWSNGAMYYGKGDDSFESFERGLDVSAHEMTHGIIDETSGLEYDGESGAINESMADVFATMVDRDDWTLGEDIVKTKYYHTGALRSLSNPNQNLSKNDFDHGWQPKHVNEQYNSPNDNGGVHYNSGIPNHAFYLFVQKLITPNRNEEEAKQIAEKIYYHAMLNYLTRQSNFSDLRASILRSTLDNFPSNQEIYDAVQIAFDSVGIMDNGNQGGSIFEVTNQDIPVNSGSEFIVYTNYNSNTRKYVGVYLKNIAANTIKKLSSLSILSKPSVTDDGSDIYFVGSNRKVYRLHFNTLSAEYESSIAIDTATHRNVSVSKDGRFLALLRLPTSNNNKIIVADLLNKTQNTFTIVDTEYPSYVSSTDINSISSIDFDLTSQYLAYDANIINTTKYKSRSGSFSTFNQWNVGFVRIWDLKNDHFGDGKIQKLFIAPYNPDPIYNFKNPVFSKNSPYIITTDYYETNLQNSVIQNSYKIVGVNIEKGQPEFIKENLSALAYPSYSVKDDSLIFNEGKTNLSVISLESNKIKGGAVGQQIKTATWASWFANGKRMLPSLHGYNIYSIDDGIIKDQISKINISNSISMDGTPFNKYLLNSSDLIASDYTTFENLQYFVNELTPFQTNYLTQSRNEILANTKAYPNPFADKIFVEIDSKQLNKVQYILYNNLGCAVISSCVILEQGLHKVKIGTSQLHAGSYYLMITIDDIKHSFHFIKT